MDIFSRTIMFIALLLLTTHLIPSSTAQQSCNGYTRFSNSLTYRDCRDLPVLNSFIHWNYHASNRSIDIAYRHTGMSTNNWVVWALNPSGPRMIGSQCLVALHNQSGNVHAYTSQVNRFETTLQQSDLSFPVRGLRAEFNNGEMSIFATIQLPGDGTTFNQVWQYGEVRENVPLRHSITGPNMQSFGSIDFSTGLTVATGASSESSRIRKRNTHGVLNVVSWGVLMPMGAMAARYLKVFKFANPAWFYLHVSVQTSAYIVGVAGWATGLKLGSDSSGVEQTKHRNIGIVLFALGTLQVFALLLRPKPDHKFRLYWNIYHHAIGYSVISLSIVNILEGFDILDPEKKWKRAYIGILIALGSVALVLEAFTWIVVLKRRKEEPISSAKHQQAATNGSSHHA